MTCSWPGLCRPGIAPLGTKWAHPVLFRGSRTLEGIHTACRPPGRNIPLDTVVGLCAVYWPVLAWRSIPRPPWSTYRRRCCCSRLEARCWGGCGFERTWCNWIQTRRLWLGRGHVQKTAQPSLGTHWTGPGRRRPTCGYRCLVPNYLEPCTFLSPWPCCCRRCSSGPPRIFCRLDRRRCALWP